MSHILELEHVSKAYKRKPVLIDCSLRTQQGEVIAIVGENGAGKSTLLKIITGELPPDGGEIHWNARLGYCPQELMIYDQLTVWENLVYFGAAYGLSQATIMEMSHHYMEWLNFADYRDVLVSILSEGTKQKLNLTLALIHEPDLILLDEPYQGFDYGTYLRFLEMIDELKRQEKSILIVTHLVSRTEMFDRTTELTKGILVDENT